jgi:putative cardiolipin synthase
LGDDQLLHGKVGVFDGRVTLLGSYNLDLLSAKVNGEITAAVWSPDFARQNLDVIEGLIARGEPDVYEYRIARDAAGQPLRHPAGHADAGRVVVAFGHENHCKKELVEAVGDLVRVVDRGRDLPMLRDLMR